MKNFDELQNKVENSLGSSRRFESPQEELLNYQFQYIEKLIDGTLQPLHKKVGEYEETFEDYVFEYTEFRRYLTDEYCKKMGEGMYSDVEGERKRFEEWLDAILSEIKVNRDSDNKKYLDSIPVIIKKNLDILEPELKENGALIKENKYKEERAGLIHFNMTRGVDDLSEYGINKGDSCISIHFKDLVDQKNKDDSVSNIFSNESLSALAVQIVEKFPETKAIIAHSWIVGSPIGKRMKFTVVKEHKEVVSDSRFWGQFVDDKGKIKEDMIQEFLRTGIPKYLITDGFIKTEDFLAAHLPNDKRGKIKLLDYSKESIDFNNDIDKILGEIDHNLDLSYNDTVKIARTNTLLSQYLDTKKGEEFLKMIKYMKETGVRSVDDLIYDHKNDIRDDLNSFIEKNKNQYIEREVNIK